MVGGCQKNMPTMKTTPVPCTHCGKGWRDEQSLSKHIENAHAGEPVNSLANSKSDVVEIMDDDDDQEKSFEDQLIKSLDIARRPEQSNVTRNGQNKLKNWQNARTRQSVTRTEQVKNTNLPTQNPVSKSVLPRSNTDRLGEPEICIVKTAGSNPILAFEA